MLINVKTAIIIKNSTCSNSVILICVSILNSIKIASIKHLTQVIIKVNLNNKLQKCK
ncbi:MAG: hypothetical protein ACRCVG_02930 [Methanobacteriaceae archaeon]